MSRRNPSSRSPVETANTGRVYGKTLGRYSLGRTKGPCGRLTKRMRFMPLHRYRPGSYQYWFSHSRRFQREKAVYRIGVAIFETILPAQATAAGSP